MAINKPKGLGTLIESALSTVGVTEERVTKWLGRPCGCSERKRKLNALSDWALGLVRGKIDKGEAEKSLNEIIPLEVEASTESESPIPPPLPEQLPEA